MDSWLRIAIFAIILLSFLRRIFKIKTQGGPRFSCTAEQSSFDHAATDSWRGRSRGRKNDFRDVPPPPENPELG